MQKVQVYVEDLDGNLQLLDLFQDESIQVTSTIQDIRDIGKVFTDYSQTFNVPASDVNNKIFRHFYNYFITGATNAYDSRKKKRAEIHINYMPFRRGKIFLNSVKMKTNKPHSYVITFYGETVSLKDLIGDDELTDLSYLKNFNHEYNDTKVKEGFTDGLDFTIDGVNNEDAIIYPLITPKKRLFYNSDNPVASDFYDSSGNLYHNNTLQKQNVRGLEYTDLKPAIRAIHIIEAIESEYGISFTRSVNTTPGATRDTFFSSVAFDNLYMWLHRNKGNYNEYDLEGATLSTIFNDWTKINTEGLNTSFTEDVLTVDIPTQPSNIEGYNIDLRVYPAAASVNTDYTLSILDGATNEVLATKSGQNDLYVDINFDIDDVPRTFKFSITSNETIQYDYTVDPVTVFVSTFDNDRNPVDVEEYNSANQSMINEVLMERTMPKMKVIDFLTGIFKVFNLTAFYIDDVSDSNFGKIYVDTLDNFYNDGQYNKLGTTIDITKYRDIKDHQVDSVLPFTDIEFKYEETNVVLMENHLARFNEVFGDAEFNVRKNFPNKIDRGTKYELKVPFSHMKYERLFDLGSAGGVTKIQWGYCASGDFNAEDEDATYPGVPKGDYDTTTIKPLLFYGINQTFTLPAGPTVGTINWIYNLSPSSIEDYWRPSNSNEEGDDTTAPAFTLNFDTEVDEWQRQDYGDENNSLYEVFYKKYVEGVFNPTKRMFKVRAKLPPNIIVNYRLNNQIKIQDMVFRINSITTELTTGQSEIELLNILDDEILE